MHIKARQGEAGRGGGLYSFRSIGGFGPFLSFQHRGAIRDDTSTAVSPSRTAVDKGGYLSSLSARLQCVL